MKINKTWKLPKPELVNDEYEWLPVVRVGRIVPFGYRQDPDDGDILLPIPEELEFSSSDGINSTFTTSLSGTAIATPQGLTS